MERIRKSYICERCNYVHDRFWGKCQGCGAFNTLHEDAIEEKEFVKIVSQPVSSKKVPSGWEEFDNVLGGGIVEGSVILIGGEPGIGKSTLVGQVCSKVKGAIYFSGEETADQVALRCHRIGLDEFQVASTGVLESILAVIAQKKPPLVVIDSVQTLRDKNGPASTEQIRNFVSDLVQCAKKHKCSMLLIGHVTKSGNLAGPKLLEHMVDVVMVFEGDQEIRRLSSTKNRFGSTEEIGLFVMTEKGLEAVQDPSAHLCSFRDSPAVGSIIFPSREGNRNVLVEIQALVSKSHLQMPRRSVVGWCYHRMAMLLAILENHAKLNLGSKDVYLNVVGGMRVMDTASADLAAAIAIWSSATNTPVPQNAAAFGEITLTGDIRSAKAYKDRIALCQKYSIHRIIDSSKVGNLSKDYLKEIL